MPVVQTNISRFTSKIVTLAQKAVVGNPAPALKKGSSGYADWVMISIISLKEYLDQPYRRLLDLLTEMPGVVTHLDLAVSELPHFSTVCRRMQELKMDCWRVLLRLSAELHDLGEIQAIDATGFDRIAASQHYANRTNYSFSAVKFTTLIDCKTNTILDIHCSMKQPHDTQVGWQVLNRNLDKLTYITADKGYDWELLRKKLEVEDVKPVIKHRGFSWQDIANNALIDDTIYNKRSNAESTFFALRTRYNDTLRSRTWFGQYRELAIKCVVRNIELAVRV